MKNIQYNKEVDVLIISFTDHSVVDSDEIAPNVIADYDSEGNIIRIEILHFSTYQGIETLKYLSL